jgi:hypothetical protein
MLIRTVARPGMRDFIAINTICGRRVQFRMAAVSEALRDRLRILWKGPGPRHRTCLHHPPGYLPQRILREELLHEREEDVVLFVDVVYELVDDDLRLIAGGEERLF